MRNLVILVAALCASQFYRSAPAVLGLMIGHDLDLDPADLGQLSAAFFLGFAAAQLPVGVALDRWGPKLTIAVCLTLGTAAAWLLSIAWNLGSVIVAEACLGVACSPIFMGTLVVFARLYPPERFATLSGLFLGIGNLGSLASATPLALLAEGLGWRAAMQVIAVATAVLTLAVAWGVVGGSSGRRESLGRTVRDVGQVLGLRTLWPILPICFATSAVPLAIRGLWGGPYLQDVFGVDAVMRGHALLAMALAILIGGPVYGRMARLYGAKRAVVVGSVLSIGVLLVMALFPAAGLLPAVALMALLGGISQTYGPIMAHGKVFVPAHLMGRGVTLMNFCVFAGIGVMQVALGLVVDQAAHAGLAPLDRYRLVFLALALLLGSALLVYRSSKSDRP